LTLPCPPAIPSEVTFIGIIKLIWSESNLLDRRTEEKAPDQSRSGAFQGAEDLLSGPFQRNFIGDFKD
jgi:hypothetical protein